VYIVINLLLGALASFLERRFAPGRAGRAAVQAGQAVVEAGALGGGPAVG
jgi:hypothetical protein